MRVVIAPDKFKGSLSAREVAEAVASGLSQFHSADLCPVADGGEGFADALGSRHERVEAIRDPLGRPVSATYGWVDATTAVIGMSEASGIHRLAPHERNPWETSTFGTGQLILHAASHGASRILVGLGGSATNDAGAGLAAALGWQFLTSDGEPMDPGRPISSPSSASSRPKRSPFPASWPRADVRNPLLGPHGASRVYARQKGADDRMIEHLEMALDHLAGLVAEQIGIDYRLLPGAGAAGGLGYGLATFCSAELQPGFPLVASAMRLEERIAAADLVITGEGRLDSQTMYGKAPVEVARLAKKHGKHTALVCGQCEPGAEAAEWFDFVIALDSLEPSPELCIKNAAPLVARATAQIMDWASQFR